MAVLLAVANFVAKIVLIPAFNVHHRTEKPLTYHIEAGKFVFAVTAVLEHHIRSARTLRNLDEPETFLHRIRAAYFATYRNTRFHSGERYLRMRRPRCRDQHCVHVSLIQQFAVIGLAAGGAYSFRYRRESFIHSVFVKIAYRYDFNVFHAQNGMHQTHPSAA